MTVKVGASLLGMGSPLRFHCVSWNRKKTGRSLLAPSVTCDVTWLRPAPPPGSIFTDRPFCERLDIRSAAGSSAGWQSLDRTGPLGSTRGQYATLTHRPLVILTGAPLVDL